MRCPNLKDLPSPPPGKTGWPWTEESDVCPKNLDDKMIWPKVTIVTPSSNQGPFIEETIRSILLQGYPNLEYIIVDNVSKDDTLPIVRKYEKYLSHFICEQDKGVGDAINKGFRLSTGTILNWLNSDDIFLKNAIVTAVRGLSASHDKLTLIYGRRFRCDGFGNIFDFDLPPDNINLFQLRMGSWLPQETVFFKRELYEKIGDLSNHIALDYEYWIRCIKDGVRFKRINEFMGSMRFHDKSISVMRKKELRLNFLNLRNNLINSTFHNKFINILCDCLLIKIIFRLKLLEKRLYRCFNRKKIPAKVSCT